MKNHKLLLLIFTVLFFSVDSNASISKKKEDAQLLEELTGKKTQPLPQAKATPMAKTYKPVVSSISRRLLDAGFHAYTKKDYISALKHYNTIIVKYPKSGELHLAYLAKAKMYQEMGLIEQARLNVKLANEISKNNQSVK